MGIYWAAVDYDEKEIIHPPGDFCIKIPGIFHPDNPFPGMVIMMNTFGYNFEMINDCDWEGPYYSEQFKDITDQVYEKYLTYFK